MVEAFGALRAQGWGLAHRLLSSSFLGLPYRILKKTQSGTTLEPLGGIYGV